MTRDRLGPLSIIERAVGFIDTEEESVIQEGHGPSEALSYVILQCIASTITILVRDIVAIEGLKGRNEMKLDERNVCGVIDGRLKLLETVVGVEGREHGFTSGVHVD